MKKKKADIKDLLSKAIESEKYIAPTLPEIEITPTKLGRPSEKLPNVEYVKLSARIPIATRNALKLLLYGKLAGQYKTQDELINAALLEFINTKR